MGILESLKAAAKTPEVVTHHRTFFVPDNKPAIERIKGITERRNAQRQATQPMKDFVARLVAEINDMDKTLGDKAITYTVRLATEGMPFAQTQDWIKRLIAKRDELRAAQRMVQSTPVTVVRVPQPPVDVPDGNYAIEYAGKLHFYRVSTTKSGFRKLQERASDTLWSVDDNRRRYAILAGIRDAGIEAARMRFATELRQCWMCGRTLTDEDSRARGIGPDCAQK